MVLDFIKSVSLDENFFTVFDNNKQDTPVPSNVVRRLAHHNRTERSNLDNMFDMSKVRSFIAPEWEIDTICSFKRQRVLNIGYYYHNSRSEFDEDVIQVEHLGHLVHLRFLGMNGRHIKKIPKEIGSIKMLQTLHLMGCPILELPSSSSLPTQLVCLHILFDTTDAGMFSVERLTSLEELSLHFGLSNNEAQPRRLVKELGSLRKLRVAMITGIIFEDKEMQRDFIASLRRLHMLQDLKIQTSWASLTFEREMEFVLLGNIRTLVFDEVKLWKLPSCINSSCHPKLSHLELCLSYIDEQDLKILGGLPELRFLDLQVPHSSITIGNISDSNDCYFPELRCLRLTRSIVYFPRLRCPRRIILSADSDDSDYVLLQGSYEFTYERVKRSDLELQLHSDSGDDGEGAATAQFMPRLQVLHFDVPEQAVKLPYYRNYLDMEFLPSLQEISVRIFDQYCPWSQVEELKTALRNEAHVHPNHPTIRIEQPQSFYNSY